MFEHRHVFQSSVPACGFYSSSCHRGLADPGPAVDDSQHNSGLKCISRLSDSQCVTSYISLYNSGTASTSTHIFQIQRNIPWYLQLFANLQSCIITPTDVKRYTCLHMFNHSKHIYKGSVLWQYALLPDSLLFAHLDHLCQSMNGGSGRSGVLRW